MTRQKNFAYILGLICTWAKTQAEETWFSFHARDLHLWQMWIWPLTYIGVGHRSVQQKKNMFQKLASTLVTSDFI